MPDPVVPSPFFRTLVQTFVQTKQTTKVTAADTETDTHWEMDAEGKAHATAQKSKLTGLETESRTQWSAVSAKGGGMGFDEFVRGSAVVPMGTKATVHAPKPAGSARAVAQSTVVTAAETTTNTSWKVDGEGADQKMTATAQSSKLESFDTRTRTRWVMNENLDCLPELKALLK